MVKIYYLLIGLFLIAGCASQEKRGYGYEYKLRAKWQLQSVAGKDVTASDFTNGLPHMQIMVDAISFKGSTGCNSMSGVVQATYQTIKFSNIATTRMACEKGDEAGFLQALESATTYDVEDDLLYLRSGTKVTSIFRQVK